MLIKQKKKDDGMMNTKVKIIMAAVNIACLAITLFRPDETTPLGVLTTACSTVTWLFGSQLERKTPDFINYICVITASILALLCIILNSIGEIKQVCCVPNMYYYKCYDDIAFIGGTWCKYDGMAIGAFAVLVTIMLTEIICTFVFVEKKEQEEKQ